LHDDREREAGDCEDDAWQFGERAGERLALNAVLERQRETTERETETNRDKQRERETERD
jgi:hypothetical protein